MATGSQFDQTLTIPMGRCMAAIYDPLFPPGKNGLVLTPIVGQDVCFDNQVSSRAKRAAGRQSAGWASGHPARAKAARTAPGCGVFQPGKRTPLAHPFMPVVAMPDVMNRCRKANTTVIGSRLSTVIAST